jgi:hypothetical protein
MADKYINIGGHKVTADREMETGTFSNAGTNISVVSAGTVYYKKNNVVSLQLRWTAVTGLTSGTTYTVDTKMPNDIKPLITIAFGSWLAGYPYMINIDTNGILGIVPKTTGISTGYASTITCTYLTA